MALETWRHRKSNIETIVRHTLQSVLKRHPESLSHIDILLGSFFSGHGLWLFLRNATEYVASKFEACSSGLTVDRYSRSGAVWDNKSKRM